MVSTDKEMQEKPQGEHAASVGTAGDGNAKMTAQPTRDNALYIDIYREKPIRVAVKVIVPVKEHPKFNFVGKLLGPKGNSMKRLQEETMTRMAVLGRGSMRDKQKEEELRSSTDPKYNHLHEELHVEITAYAAPAEAHARVAFALAELRKYLIPDSNDEIRQEQMREMEILQNEAGEPGTGQDIVQAPSPAAADAVPRRLPIRGRARRPRTMRGGLLMPPPVRSRSYAAIRKSAPVAPAGTLPPAHPGTSKQKVLSILDRARVAMEEANHNFENGTYYEESGCSAYDEPCLEYYDPAPHRNGSTSGGVSWRSYSMPLFPRSPASKSLGQRTRYRNAPYPRPK